MTCSDITCYWCGVYQGAVQGPEEFAEGLVIGVRSLLGHTVGKTVYMVFVAVEYMFECVGIQCCICILIPKNIEAQ